MSRNHKESVSVKLSALDEDLMTVLLGRELYGLDILNTLNQNRPVLLGFGSLYPALNRLEKKGLISWRWGDEQEVSGGARRKYYRLNGSGVTVLRAWQEYRTQLAMRPGHGQTSLRGT